MSNEDKHIDNLFKEKLADRSFDGPPADFLDDLNQRLDEKNKKRSKGWVWIIFLNLLIVSLLIANTTIDFSTAKNAKAEGKNISKEQSEVKDKSSKKENDKKTNSTSKSDRTIIDSNGKSGDLSQAETKSNNTQSKLKEKKKKKNQQNTKDNFSINGTTNNKNEENSEQKNKNSTRNDANEDTNEKKSLNESTKVPLVGSNDNKKDQDDQKESTASIDKTVDNEDIQENTAKPISSLKSYSAIYAPEFEEIDEKIKTNDFPEFPNRFSEILAEEKTEVTEKSPKKEDENRIYELQLQGGATKWNYNTLGTNDNYVSQLDESGTSRWTPNFGLLFNANFNKISVGTGINYTKFKTENTFEFSEISAYDSTYLAGYNEDITYDTLGNPIDTTYTPYYDSTTVTDTTYNTNQITNQYEWIQIPLHFGYRFNLNKWAIIPRAGVNIGIGIRKSTGQYPNEDYNNLQTLSPVKWHLNLDTSMEIRRTFGNWHAFGKFNYQRNLTPTIDNALFERKFNGIGFNFGIG
ncbi:MAG: hypothetical protein WEA99_14785, partial [Brumimicrobium sp.]